MFWKLKSALFWPIYDQFMEVWCCDFSWSLESRGSASSEAILNFSKDLKSPVHALFTLYYDKFSINQVFWSKTPCGCAYCSDFCQFLCVTQTFVAEGGSSIPAFPPPPATPASHPYFSLNNPSLTAVGRFAHRFVGNSANMPWDNGLQKGRESKG